MPIIRSVLHRCIWSLCNEELVPMEIGLRAHTLTPHMYSKRAYEHEKYFDVFDIKRKIVYLGNIRILYTLRHT